MSIRTRIALTIAVVSLTYAGAQHIANRYIIYAQFLSIEREHAAANMARCVEAIRRENQHLALINSDWARWDESYNYLTGANPGFEADSLTDDSLKTADLNVLWIVRPDGSVRFSRAWWCDDGKRPMEFSELPADRLPLDHPLLQTGADSVTGILDTDQGPLMVASNPVLRSDSSGPSTGWIIFGRFVTPELVERLREQTRIDFAILPEAAHGAVAVPAPDSQPVLLSLTDDATIGVAHVSGLAGSPGLLVRASLPRDISHQGAKALSFATISLVGAAIFTVVALMFFLGRVVLNPLAQLTEHAVSIGDSNDLHRRINSPRRDEIGQLAHAFDRMVARLADAQSQLADTARQAGMADVARGILHNIGNVLNTANVATASIDECIRKSRLTGLEKAAAMVKDHERDLAAFLTTDDRGARIPAYLSQISEVLRAEQTQVSTDLERLRESLRHSLEIIHHQNVLSSAPACEEATPIPQLVRGAVSLCAAALQRHGVQLDVQVSATSTALLDRNKVLQILVNLVVNAKESIVAARVVDGRVRIEASETQDEFQIVVSDNGGGIAPENFARIFASGFTTKTDGRGFGLHYCGVTAQELGGSLTPSSAGIGAGASFALRLPLRRPLGSVTS